MTRSKKNWTKGKIIQDLEVLIKKINHYPSSRELQRENNGLYRNISKYGGLSHFRNVLGYEEARKPPNYWKKIQNVKKELASIIRKFGYFPSRKELYESNKADLDGAIRRSGGYVYFQKIFNYKSKTKPRGYWNDKRIIKELKNLVNEIGYVPSIKELGRIGKYGLKGAIL